MADPSVAPWLPLPDGPARDLFAEEGPARIVGVVEDLPPQLVLEVVDVLLGMAELEGCEETSQVRFASHLALEPTPRRRRQFFVLDLPASERMREIRVGCPVRAQLGDCESSSVEVAQGSLEPAFQLRLAAALALQEPIPIQGARRVGRIDSELHLREFQEAVASARYHVVDTVDAAVFGFDADPCVGFWVAVELEQSIYGDEVLVSEPFADEPGFLQPDLRHVGILTESHRNPIPSVVHSTASTSQILLDHARLFCPTVSRGYVAPVDAHFESTPRSTCRPSKRHGRTPTSAMACMGASTTDLGFFIIRHPHGIMR